MVTINLDSTTLPTQLPTAKENAAEVSMDRIRIGYPVGYLRFFRIRFAFGFSILKKI